jgi:hypothetical protein
MGNQVNDMHFQKFHHDLDKSYWEFIGSPNYDTSNEGSDVKVNLEILHDDFQHCSEISVVNFQQSSLVINSENFQNCEQFNTKFSSHHCP